MNFSAESATTDELDRQLGLSEAAEQRLKGLTPGQYTGLAEQLVERYAN